MNSDTMFRCLVFYSACFLLAAMLVETNPIPSSSPSDLQHLLDLIEMARTAEGPDKCLNDNDMKDTCESCSKVAKSVVVYPLCCKEKMGVKEWCVEFLHYSLKEFVARWWTRSAYKYIYIFKFVLIYFALFVLIFPPIVTVAEILNSGFYLPLLKYSDDVSWYFKKMMVINAFIWTCLPVLIQPFIL